jgi:hypothetical protein
MVPLDVAATWTRMLSVAAGACAAAGAPGPGTRVGGKPAVRWSTGPWLGLFDFEAVKRAEQEVLLPWLSQHAEALLLVRHLLLGEPLGDEVRIELTQLAREAMPDGYTDAARPILFLAPAGRVRPERRREYVDALSRLRIPLTSGGSALWGLREIDVDLLVAVAQLADETERSSFRTALDPSQRRLFDLQLPLVEAALLDDLVGGRDEAGALGLELESVSSLHPQAHPMAVFGAVERVHNRRRADKERTQFSARTIEARASARGFPESVPPMPAGFEAKASDSGPLLGAELQRVFEAYELLSKE